jgi:hypothetical protein
MAIEKHTTIDEAAAYIATRGEYCVLVSTEEHDLTEVLGYVVEHYRLAQTESEIFSIPNTTPALHCLIIKQAALPALALADTLKAVPCGSKPPFLTELLSTICYIPFDAEALKFMPQILRAGDKVGLSDQGLHRN